MLIDDGRAAVRRAGMAARETVEKTMTGRESV